jgi:hypothetical protein
MIRVFDFRCEAGHVTEHFIHAETLVVNCKQCGKIAHRMIPAPRSNLEGITGHFPGAADKWVRNRNQKMREEKRITDNHGPQKGHWEK